jgi:hypothetical protein
MAAAQEAKQGMAKIQKTFYLNEELSLSVDALCEGTGASFTKIVTASLLCYILGQPVEKKKRWMREAVALEARTLSLTTILVHNLQDRIESAEGQIELYKALDDDASVQRWRETHKRLKWCMKQVQETMEGEPDAVDKLVKLFSGIEI